MCVSNGSLTETKNRAGDSGDRRRRRRGTRGSHVGCAFRAVLLALRVGWFLLYLVRVRPNGSAWAGWMETLTFPLLRVLLFPLALHDLGVLARLLLALVHVDEVLASVMSADTCRRVSSLSLVHRVLDQNLLRLRAQPHLERRGQVREPRVAVLDTRRVAGTDDPDVSLRYLLSTHDLITCDRASFMMELILELCASSDN